MQIELRHLRILKAVSDHGSLTRAAAALGISQPTLTKQVQRIEDELGAPVFTRGRQGARLTAFGKFVLARTKAVLTNIDDILAYRPRRGGLGEVRFGGTMPPWVADLLDRLAVLEANTHLTVHSERAIGTTVEMVLGRRLDLALVADYPGHVMDEPAELVCATVRVEPVFVALSAGHPLAARPEIDLADLAGEAWVIPHSDGMGWPEHLDEVCADLGFQPSGRYRLFDTTLRRELAATGRAVYACQATVREDERVAVRPLVGDPLWMRHLLLWRRDSPLAAYGAELAVTAAAAYEAAIESAPVYARWRARRGDDGTGERLFHSP